jgi:hypothetical protein
MGTFVTKTGNQIRGRWHNNVMEWVLIILCLSIQ